MLNFNVSLVIVIKPKAKHTYRVVAMSLLCIIW